jgi:hypothetical protein
MSRLTDYELDQLLQDAQVSDRSMKTFFPRSEYKPITSRITRLLQESKELRDQAAERTHMAELEGDN